MLNALKTPFPDDYDPDSTEEQGEKKFFKYKRPLLNIFVLVLVVGAFSLFANQKTDDVAENNLPKPSIPAPPASKQVIDRSPPTVEKLHSTPIPEPLYKNTVSELVYKSDKEYLALTRYERFAQATKKPVKGNGKRVRDTVAIVDKPLTLGGRGFDFKRRQLQPKTDRFGNFAHRLQKPFPKMDPIPEDHLDLQLIQTKSSKDLIFHPMRPALGKYNRQKVYLKGQIPDDKNPQVLQEISDTKLLLMEADNSLLILRRSRESLDLLSGNEKINRNEFTRW
jgi:hypothetical protein